MGRGIGATLPLAGFFQIGWFPPSRARKQPCARRWRSKSAVSRNGQFKLLAHRAGHGVLACFLAVVRHRLLKGAPEIAPGFIHGFAFGKNFRPKLHAGWAIGEPDDLQQANSAFATARTYSDQPSRYG